MFKAFAFEKNNHSNYDVFVNKSLLREALQSSITVNGNPLSTYTNYNDPFLEDFHKLEPPTLLSFVKKPQISFKANVSETSVESSFTDSFDSHKIKKQLYKPPSKNKHKGFQLVDTKSKIDWNLKYQFPKNINNLFDYQVKSSKIDILNKNLEKKIS